MAVVQEDENLPEPQPCEPLRISYRDPLRGHVLTEDVFLDPRDSWRDGDNLLLVDAHSVTGLQFQLDKAAHWFREAKGTLSTCRHDWLRERQYLLEELRAIARSAADHQTRKDAQDVIDKATLSQPDQANEASEEEVMTLADGMGPRSAADEPLVDYLRKAGIDTSDELTVRILLNLMRDGVREFEERKARLTKQVEMLEGTTSGSSLVQTTLDAAADQGASKMEVITTLLEKANDARHLQLLEDLVTGGLRQAYEDANQKYNELKPQLTQWKALFRENQEAAERLTILEEEVEVANTEVQEQEAARQEYQEEKARREKEREANLAEERMRNLLTKEDKAELKQSEKAIHHMTLEENALQQELHQLEEEVQSRREARQNQEERIEEVQSQLAQIQAEVEQAEADNQQAQEGIREMQEKDREFDERKMHLEDEQAAAKIPRGKKIDLSGIESELAAAEKMNQDLLSEEMAILEKEKQYQQTFEEAERALAEAGEIPAAGVAGVTDDGDQTQKRIRLDKAREAAWRSDEDPDLLHYYKRVDSGARAPILHTDARARARDLYRQERKARTSIDDRWLQEDSKFSATTADTDGAGFVSGGPSWQLFDMNLEEGEEEYLPYFKRRDEVANKTVPVGFRYPEDLRHRLAYTQQAVQEMSGSLSQRGSRSAVLAEELRLQAAQLRQSYGAGGAAALSASVGAAARLSTASASSEGAELAPAVARLRGSLSEAGDKGAVADALSSELRLALDKHKASEERFQDAWERAVRGCELGAGEWELALEEERCAACSEELKQDVVGLRAESTIAAAGGPPSLAGFARHVVAALDAGKTARGAAVAAQRAAWLEVLRLAGQMGRERATEESLLTLMRAEARRSALLQEMQAPPEARSALARLREGTYAVLRGIPAPSRLQPVVHRQVVEETPKVTKEAALAPLERHPALVPESPRWHQNSAGPSRSASPQPLRPVSSAGAREAPSR